MAQAKLNSPASETPRCRWSTSSGGLLSILVDTSGQGGANSQDHSDPSRVPIALRRQRAPARAELPERVQRAVVQLVGMLGRQLPSELSGPRPAPASGRTPSARRRISRRGACAEWLHRRRAPSRPTAVSRSPTSPRRWPQNSRQVSPRPNGRRAKPSIRPGSRSGNSRSAASWSASEPSSTSGPSSPTPRCRCARPRQARVKQPLVWRTSRISCSGSCKSVASPGVPMPPSTKRPPATRVRSSWPPGPSARPPPRVHATGSPATISAQSPEQRGRPTPSGARPRSGSAIRIALVGDTLPSAP